MEYARIYCELNIGNIHEFAVGVVIKGNTNKATTLLRCLISASDTVIRLPIHRKLGNFKDQYKSSGASHLLLPRIVSANFYFLNKTKMKPLS